VNLRPNFNSILTRLILMGSALFLVGMFGRIFLLSDYMRADLTDLTSAQLITIANYVAEDVDRDVVARRELLQHAASNFPLALLQDRKALQAWLGERHDINPLFSLGMFVLDTSGVILADYPVVADRVGISSADRDYFQQAMLGEFAIGRPVIGRAARVPVLPMAMPLRDSSGKVLAVLVGISALHSPNFLEALYSTHVGSTGGLVLVSPRDKLFIGASDADIVLNPTPRQGLHPQLDRAMMGWRGVGVDDRNGIEELAAVASVPNAGWFVVARMPTSEVYAPLSRLHRFIVNNTVYMVPLFFLIIVLGLRYLLRPLTKAAQHADRMTRDEIPLEPLPVVRDDEVGHLTQAFNRILTKLIESRAELQHIAHHDALTGLPNRQLLADRMHQALARAQRSKGKIAVLFLDLDGFKPINDGLGHEAGDAALREVTLRLREAVRSEDTLARVGGDEFVILLSDLNANAKEVAELVASKCLEVFGRPFSIRDQSCKLGTSIGIALGDGECDADKLLIAADQAMYRAKEAGRGKFVYADGCSACGDTGECDIHIPGNKLRQ
jgi:diguanylate cyclase (GGDEF)-like protein